jgi:hypothetical protein
MPLIGERQLRPSQRALCHVDETDSSTCSAYWMNGGSNMLLTGTDISFWHLFKGVAGSPVILVGPDRTEAGVQAAVR